MNPFSSIAESDSDDVPTATIKIQTRDTFDYTEKNAIKSGETRIINKTLPPGKFNLRLNSTKKVICSIVVSYMGRPFYELRAQVGGSKKNQKFEAVLVVDKEKNPAIFQAKLENKSRLFGSPSQYKFEIKKEQSVQSSPYPPDEKIQLKVLLSDAELGKLSIRKIAVPITVTFDDLLFILRREFNFPHLLLQYEDKEDGSMIDICSQEGWEPLLTQYREGLISFITLVITPVIDIVSQSDTESSVSRNPVNSSMPRKPGKSLTSLRTKSTPYGNPIILSDDNRDMDTIHHSRESSRDSMSSPVRIASNTDIPFEPHSAPAGFSHHHNSNGSNFSASSGQSTQSSNPSPPLGHRQTNSTIGFLQRRSHDDDDLFGSPTRITSAVLELRSLKEFSQGNEIQPQPKQSGSMSASVSPRVSSSSPTKMSATATDPRQLEKLKRRLSQEFSRRYQANFYDDPRTISAMPSQSSTQIDRDAPSSGERRNKTVISGSGGGGGMISNSSGSGATAATTTATTTATLSNANPRLDSKKFAIPSQSNKQHSNKHVHGQIRWKRANLIGSGAFGNVYLGMDTKTGKFLAVKQIEVGKSLTAEQKRKLEEEIALMKNLSHPHIVRYYGMEITERYINIFLEYVPGGSIESLLRKFGKFGDTVASCYTQQILLGLQYLHERGVLHRDIKGANLLVDENGNVKLADFGSSKSIDELNATVGGRSLTGTPNFMAPEVIINAKYTNGSDIWAVGCTLLEMLTGQPPWAQMNFDNPISAMFYIAQSKEGPKVPDHLSEQAKSFISACFSMDSDDRPTAAELLKHPFITNVQENISDEDSDEEAEYQVATPVGMPNQVDLLPVAETSQDAVSRQPQSPQPPVVTRPDDGDFNKTDQAMIEYEDWSSSELVTDYDQQSTDSASETEGQEEPAQLSSSSGSEKSPIERRTTPNRGASVPYLPSLVIPQHLSPDKPSNSAEMLSQFMAAKARGHLSKSSRRHQSARFDSRAKILTPYILSFLRRNAAEQRSMLSMNEESPTSDTKTTSPQSDSPPSVASSSSPAPDVPSPGPGVVVAESVNS